MALLAEALVEEWLNRQGFFTIRGIKIGVDEIDLLAIRFIETFPPECRHIEVQASMRPISYITKIPGQKAKNAAKLPPELMQKCVKEWVFKKFKNPKKTNVIKKLFPDHWTTELVVNNVKSEEELALIEKEGIRLIRLSHIIKELNKENFQLKSASRGDFVDLIHLALQNT